MGLAFCEVHCVTAESSNKTAQVFETPEGNLISGSDLIESTGSIINSAADCQG